MPFICGLLWLLSNITFTIAHKFKNGFEIKFDMKGRDFMVFICCVIGVLGMVPTGGSGCCSRMLKGERNAGCVKYRRSNPVRFDSSDAHQGAVYSGTFSYIIGKKSVRDLRLGCILALYW